MVAVVGLGLCVGLTMLLLCSIGWDSAHWRRQLGRRASEAETEPVQFAKTPRRFVCARAFICGCRC